MKKLKWLSLFFLIFLIFLPKIGFSQENPIIQDTGYPIPPYIKRGLTIYYNVSGYVTKQGRKEYATFEKIIIVQAIEGQNVIGTIYSMNPTSQMLTTETKILGHGGFGLFYVHPEYAKKMQGKEYFGYKFPSPGIISYKKNNAEGSIQYDPKSGLFLGLKVNSFTTESVEVYKGYEYTTLPNLPVSFPNSARRNYTYSIYNIMQGMNMPFGTISVSPVWFGKKTAKFKLTTSTNEGISSTKELYGTTLIGPCYIHPSILKDEYNILNLKQKDLKFYIQGENQYGKIAHLIINGTEYYTTHIDPYTGLIQYQDQYIIGMNSIVRVVLNQ